MKKLLVFLTDPLRTSYEKGEVKPRYYNPGNLFDEVHFVSPARTDIGAETVQTIVGDARMVVHALGPRYYVGGALPFGRLASLVEKVQPDATRAYDPGLRGSLAVYWGRRLRVPSVISVHADLDDQRERRVAPQVRRLLERYSLSRADVVICVTHYLRSYAERYGARRVMVIYNRVFPEQFANTCDRAREERKATNVRILSVGRLVRPKYQECLIRAISGLEVRLTLVGDGPLREHLVRVVRQLCLEDRVDFVSAVLHAEIARYYRAADMFAIATYSEGFCIPVLEAMAAGLPVIASRVGAIEEIVGDAGFLVENRPEAFRRVIETLARDPALRREIGERARRRACALNGQVMEDREKALYQSLCGGGA